MSAAMNPGEAFIARHFELQGQVEEFNRMHPVGSTVQFRLYGETEVRTGIVEQAAMVFRDNTTGVGLKGIGLCVPLSWVIQEVSA